MLRTLDSDFILHVGPDSSPSSHARVASSTPSFVMEPGFAASPASASGMSPLETEIIYLFEQQDLDISHPSHRHTAQARAMKRKLNERDEPAPVEVHSDQLSAKAATENSTGKTFSGLGLDPRLLRALNKQQFTAPTSVQSKAIPVAIQGKDVLARARTGSGKTLAYLLPLLHAVLQRKNTDKRGRATTALILVPTKELATQVTTTISTFSSACGKLVRCENIARKEDGNATRARLAEGPDLVVATPGRSNQCINNETLSLRALKHLVIDEADLVLSYGYEEDLQSIAAALPPGVQKMMMSATLRTDIDALSKLFLADEGAEAPTILDLSEEEAAEKATLTQYTLRTGEDEKFLLIYAIFKLRLIKGKVIVFVADIDRCYRVKLFLEQFGIRSCVLNSELPVNSRLHVVQEFNRGVYDIVIAADEAEIVGGEEHKRKPRKADVDEEDDATEKQPLGRAEANQQKDQSIVTSLKRKREDREFGVSRGIDFRHVTCVLNFDLPTTAKSYTHRVGRTARAGQAGMALSFYVPKDLYRKHKPTSIPQCADDEGVLAKIRVSQSKKGSEVNEWGLDWTKLDGFRYRLVDALRAVTRIAVRQARTSELRNELIKSEKLKRHFEENPDDLRHLRHDTESHAIRQQPHLKHVPQYLLPAGGKAAVSKEVGFVGMRKDLGAENRIRKARAFNKERGKGRLAERKRRGGGDPLKTLNAMGRKKK